jgi:hypothetical protein
MVYRRIGSKVGMGMCAAAMLSIVGWSPWASAATSSSASAARPPVIKIAGSAIAAALADRSATASPAMARAEKAFTALKSITNAPADTIYCYGNVSIQSDENLRFVSEEQGYTGANAHMLRARASVVGPWELYSTCRDQNTGLTDILSQEDNLFVSEEQGYTGANRFELRARASVVGPWERWYTNDNPCNGCGVAFVSGENGNFVSEEQGYTGYNQFELRARAAVLGPWETFNW